MFYVKVTLFIKIKLKYIHKTVQKVILNDMSKCLALLWCSSAICPLIFSKLLLKMNCNSPSSMGVLTQAAPMLILATYCW